MAFTTSTGKAYHWRHQSASIRHSGLKFDMYAVCFGSDRLDATGSRCVFGVVFRNVASWPGEIRPQDNLSQQATCVRRPGALVSIALTRKTQRKQTRAGRPQRLGSGGRSRQVPLYGRYCAFRMLSGEDSTGVRVPTRGRASAANARVCYGRNMTVTREPVCHPLRIHSTISIREHRTNVFTRHGKPGTSSEPEKSGFLVDRPRTAPYFHGISLACRRLVSRFVVGGAPK